MRALVTGATGQLGRECCKALEGAGWTVFAVARNVPDNRFNSVDLCDRARVIDLAKMLFGLDLVIMTHGVQQPALLGHYRDDYDRVRTSNLDSAVWLTDALIQFNCLNPGALFVYCSSIHVTHPRVSRGPYAIAKAGLEALVRVLALEQAENGIRAIALRLGQMTKPMAGVVFTPEQEAAIRERTPLPWVDPADVARLCLDLYSQKSLSGAALDVDSAHSLNVWP